MIRKNPAYTYSDLTICPAQSSSITSRKDVNPFDKDGKLPIFVAPMTPIIDDGNYNFFNKYVHVVMPRGTDEDLIKNIKLQRFVAASLDQFRNVFCNDSKKVEHPFLGGLTYYVCIDIANGHMLPMLRNLCKRAKEYAETIGCEFKIMIGNVGNPETYGEICGYRHDNPVDCDFVRLGIGSGSACITSSNTGIHYPMASLIDECRYIQKNIPRENIPAIVADGGIRNYSDVVKALALGADYVMIGGLMGQTIEASAYIMASSDPSYKFHRLYYGNSLTTKEEEKKYHYWYTTFNGDINLLEDDEQNERLKRSICKFVHVKREFYGMASRKGQSDISGEATKTSEGKEPFSVPVKFTLRQWCENMESYLRSAMSYCDAKSLWHFKDQWMIPNTPNAIAAVNK